MNRRLGRIGLSLISALTLVAGVAVVASSWKSVGRTHVIAYFENSNGIYAGDDVVLLGVPVGKIESIEPQPDKVKISFWFTDDNKVPADARAVILSPQLVTSRAIQLTPAYTEGPEMRDGAVLAEDRTAVPVEWDDFREQLEKFTDYLQPTQPGGVSTVGELINTTADNLRGQGPNIRDTIIKLAKAFSALGDHSGDLFSTMKNLATLVSALESSTDLMKQLNTNFAAVTALLANDPNEVGQAVNDINAAANDVQGFVRDNKDSLGTTSEKLASVTNAVVASLDDIKQTLHVMPTTAANFVNVYEPAHAANTGIFAITNFNNPLQLLCGGIQAASRLGAEQSAKLCAQYLAPIIKNRQYNFLPFGENFIVGAQARPNEITYSEDWLRPDFRPAPPAAAPPDVQPPGVRPGPGPQSLTAQSASGGPSLPAELPTATDPGAGLPGMMIPGGGGS